MAENLRQKLDNANTSTLGNYLAKLYDDAALVAGETTALGFGGILASCRAYNRTRTDLTSGTEHVHDEACRIYAVQTPIGTPLAMISGGSPGAGEVSVDYDAQTGIPTLTFAGAVTTYAVHCSGPVPTTIAAAMASLDATF